MFITHLTCSAWFSDEPTYLYVFDFDLFSGPVSTGFWNSEQLMLQLLSYNSDHSVNQKRAAFFCPVQLGNKLEFANSTVRTELLFSRLLTTEHSLFQGNLFLHGCIRCFWSKAVRKAWENHFSSRFTLASSQSLSALVFCRQGLQRLRQAIYSSGLHLKVRSLNIDWERMWVPFSSPPPVTRRGMLVYWNMLGNPFQRKQCVCLKYQPYLI